jgi:hypothetical protein
MSREVERKGWIVWDEEREQIQTDYGILNVWKSGRIGSGSEYHHGELKTSRRLDGDEIRGLEVEHNLRSGDIFEKRSPKEVEIGEGVFVYTWSYSPFTD